MIALDLLRSAYRLAGILHEGQGPNPDDLTDGLFVWNSMLDAWNTERLNVYVVTRETLALTAGKAAYEIGPGAADWSTVPRPVRIEKARLLKPGTTQSYEHPVDIVPHAQWADIQVKTVPSGLADKLYYEPMFPFGKVNLYPIPASSANSLILYVWTPFTQVADETVSLALPPGYADAMRYELAVRLTPEWSKAPRPDVLALAAAAKQAIQTLNAGLLDGSLATGPLPTAVVPQPAGATQ